jgi:hypothetical protein
MLADEHDYEGVPYADLVFEDIDWSEVGEHDPARRSGRKGTTERNVLTEWATEGCQDDRRWVRSAGSASGLTVSALVGRHRLGSQQLRDQGIRGGPMSEGIRETLTREAAEAEARAEAEERGEVMPAPGQRGRKRAADPSQVYAVRIPVSRLRELRRVAEQLDTPPTVLIRRWVLERLDTMDAGGTDPGVNDDVPDVVPGAAVAEVKLGRRRRRGVRHVVQSGDEQERLHA